MPNWGNGNSKAVEARAKKVAVREEHRANEKRQIEDAAWKDEVTEAKNSKKEELASKQQEKVQRKAELKALAKNEEALFTSNKKINEGPSKLTRAQIQQRALLAATVKAKEEEKSKSSLLNAFETENPNRLRREEERLAREQGQEFISASSVSEFVNQLNPDQPDRFLTKRMKAAYTAYEEEWIEILKRENPTLKRSQMKEKIWKQWQKAPENPQNQTQVMEDN